MTNANKEVDHDALNELIHGWMKESPKLFVSDLATEYSTDYDLVPLLQRRCDEMDWQLDYQRAGNAPTRNGGEWYTVQVQLPKLGARTFAATNTLPLAICRAIESAIDELKPEPERDLVFMRGPSGFIKFRGFGDEQNYGLIADRLKSSVSGADGVRFHGEPLVHIENPDQLRDIARWPNNSADDIESREPKPEPVADGVVKCTFGETADEVCLEDDRGQSLRFTCEDSQGVVVRMDGAPTGFLIGDKYQVGMLSDWLASKVAMIGDKSRNESAIEELKPEPETRLQITIGSGGYVQCKRSGMDGPHTILIRGVRDECGGDGVQFCCGLSVHITDVGQLRDIAQWLNRMANGIKNDTPF